MSWMHAMIIHEIGRCLLGRAPENVMLFYRTYVKCLGSPFRWRVLFFENGCKCFIHKPGCRRAQHRCGAGVFRAGARRQSRVVLGVCAERGSSRREGLSFQRRKYPHSFFRSPVGDITLYYLLFYFCIVWCTISNYPSVPGRSIPPVVGRRARGRRGLQHGRGGRGVELGRGGKHAGAAAEVAETEAARRRVSAPQATLLRRRCRAAESVWEPVGLHTLARWQEFAWRWVSWI